jgi:hypothetical protein
MLSTNPAWVETKDRASRENSWFIPEFVELAVQTIAGLFLRSPVLDEWVASYQIPAEHANPKKVGIVMAGNIPLVGFHDFMCVFISGHKAVIKPSSRDNVLIRHLVDTMVEWEPAVNDLAMFSDMPRNCDAYIATGSNTSAGYFEYYFKKYPHIIRRNRTSVAILTGEETAHELTLLADDVYTYFGLGCRNVTKIYVPKGYDFIPLLRKFDKYNYLADYHKYKNNYDYNLAIHILNKKYYMSNDSIILVELPGVFSPIGQLHYEFYEGMTPLYDSLSGNPDIQCVVGRDFVPFGQAQQPSITDYADGVDTLEFLSRL